MQVMSPVVAYIYTKDCTASLPGELEMLVIRCFYAQLNLCAKAFSRLTKQKAYLQMCSILMWATVLR